MWKCRFVYFCKFWTIVKLIEEIDKRAHTVRLRLPQIMTKRGTYESIHRKFTKKQMPSSQQNMAQLGN